MLNPCQNLITKYYRHDNYVNQLWWENKMHWMHCPLFQNAVVSRVLWTVLTRTQSPGQCKMPPPKKKSVRPVKSSLFENLKQVGQLQHRLLGFWMHRNFAGNLAQQPKEIDIQPRLFMGMNKFSSSHHNLPVHTCLWVHWNLKDLKGLCNTLFHLGNEN